LEISSANVSCLSRERLGGDFDPNVLTARDLAESDEGQGVNSFLVGKHPQF
jgi:hypothetical protein